MAFDDEIGIEFGANKVDGGFWPMHMTGREFILQLFGDDVGAPITTVTIKAKTDDGKTVSVTFCNDDSDTVHAEIE